MGMIRIFGVIMVFIWTLQAQKLGTLTVLEGAAMVSSLGAAKEVHLGDRIAREDVLISRDADKVQYMYSHDRLVAPNPKGALLVRQRLSPTPLHVKQAVYGGDKISTDHNGTLRIDFVDGSALEASGGVSFVIAPDACRDANDSVAVKMLRGSARHIADDGNVTQLR